jgi:hypothetical protein
MTQKKPTLKRKILHAGGWQVAKRTAKMLPFGGTIIVVALVGSNIRKKGLLGGVVNSGLDAIPIFGLAKNAVELVRGDFIPDRSSNGDGKRKLK